MQENENVNALTTTTPEAEQFELHQRQATMFAMSPLVPKHLREGDKAQAIANCYIALKMAEIMGESPLIVMQNIHVVNGKAGFDTKYMIARANKSGIFAGRIDWEVDRSDPQNLSITAFAILKDGGARIEFTCDMKMATAEGWIRNPKYKSMPDLMLRYRSAALLIRLYAPEVMLGYHTAEELVDVAGPSAVIDATTTARPMTRNLLAKQASGEALTNDADEQPAHDAETGELVEQEAAREATPPDHPAHARAQAIIVEIANCANVGDLNALEDERTLEVSYMPDDIAEKVMGVFSARLDELTPAQ